MEENACVEELKKDISKKSIHIELSESKETMLENDLAKYGKALSNNLDNRFPESTQKVLSFSVFNVGNFPKDYQSNEFSFYVEEEIKKSTTLFFP